MEMATKAIGAANGCGVPTIKPWNIDTIKEKMAEAKASGCFAVAIDVYKRQLPGPAASAWTPLAWALRLAPCCRSGRRCPAQMTSCGPLPR